MSAPSAPPAEPAIVSHRNRKPEEMNQTPAQLQRLANEMRVDIIRMLHKAGSGHPGGSLSAIDIMTCLFWNHIRRTPENALDPARHRFVLSKGHGVPALYAILKRLSIITDAEMMTLRTVDSRLQGHPHRMALPYVEASSGSLGQGLSIAQGMAMGAKLDKSSVKIYCLMGDGETQEGQVWEAFLSAAKYRLDNLIVILDCNKSQIDGFTKDVMDLEPLADKLRAFNWDVRRIDGHDMRAIDTAVTAAQKEEGKPHYIIADTIKGKGVSFMENKIEWHGKAPNDGQAEEAIRELEALLREGER